MNISNYKSHPKRIGSGNHRLANPRSFFWRLLAKTVKVIDSSSYGISVFSFKQETVRLHINPNYWNNHLKSDDEKQTLQRRKNALKKHVLHFIFYHDLQFHDFENKEAFILTAELTVSQYLENHEKIAGIICWEGKLK